jgi:ubiquitin thioesterase protein OTUB1
MENSRPTDEQILKYEREIKDLENKDKPLVSKLVGFDTLDQEYAFGSPIFKQKIQELKDSCSSMRMIKKDGNCFYRAFAYRCIELVRQNKDMKRIKDLTSLFEETGYDWSIIEFFWEPFWECINDTSDLETTFNSEYTSDTIVSFLRIATAAYLKKHRELYEVFILDSYPTLEAFLGACVEPSILC